MCFIYIRETKDWKSDNIVKLGKTQNIINRESTYITGEYYRGYYLNVYKLNSDSQSLLNIIDKFLINELKEYHKYNGGGKEFYSKEILTKVDNILIEFFSGKYKKLTQEEIHEIEREAYLNYLIDKNQILNKLVRAFRDRKIEWGERHYQVDIIKNGLDKLRECSKFYLELENR